MFGMLLKYMDVRMNDGRAVAVRFSPNTSVSPANHSTKFSIIIITRGWHNRAIGSCSAEWTQLTPPPITPIKKNELM
jgi:hypothetical protein